MSEYQYYEFRAIDKPLGESEMRALRDLSSRADITPSSFVNEYNYGDFRGSPESLMEKYFDAHLYLANWGAHRLMLRLPRRLLDQKTVAPYCAGRLAQARKKGEFLILDWNAEEDSGDGDWEEDGGSWLSGIVALRAELLRGDLRVLYLGWLLCAQGGELDDEDVEPPVPSGIGKLSASLARFADFLNIGPALIEVAAEGQAEAAEDDSHNRLVAWIDGLPSAKKNEYLLRLADSDDPHLRTELLQAFLRATGGGVDRPSTPARRSVGTLLEAARVRAEENERKETEREAKARARAEQKAARDQKKRLDALAKDPPAAWQKVDALIATKENTKYDEAVRLLSDLRELAVRDGSLDTFVADLNERRARHKTKLALLRRINEAGLRKTRDE